MKKALRKLAVWVERKAMRLSPELGVKLRYFRYFGKRLDLKDPKTFAEKIQWMKLHDRDARIVEYADKYLVREHIRKTVGEEYLIPMPYVWDRAEDVDFDVLPDSFVLKPNNSSGRVLICKDKKTLDIEKARRTLKAWEQENLTLVTGEWVYEKIPFKIVCEQFLEDEIVDYKMYFADGRFICTQIIAGRSQGSKAFAYMDDQWQLLDIRRKNGNAVTQVPEKPRDYEQMLAVAEQLAQGFTFIRVDLYYVAGRIYFGELSFYPNNGFICYETKEMDDFFASRVKLPQEKQAGEHSGT